MSNNTEQQGAIPAEIIDWIDDWKRKNIVSSPDDWQMHSLKTAFAAAIAIDLYRYLAPKLTETKAPVLRWVKANERLPEKGKNVILKYKSGDIDQKSYCGPANWWQRNVDEWLEEITAPQTDIPHNYDDVVKWRSREISALQSQLSSKEKEIRDYRKALEKINVDSKDRWECEQIARNILDKYPSTDEKNV